ncbi:hypothetical protein [Metamycoplasma equirhinis]|uniref:hypothetical protein n=1 Tax=Metamycoplasma equirhinis TaxID=92402 RepID=UPI003593677B
MSFSVFEFAFFNAKQHPINDNININAPSENIGLKTLSFSRYAKFAHYAENATFAIKIAIQT